MKPTSRQLRRFHISPVLLLCGAALLSAALASNIQAGIVTTTGMSVQLTPPAPNVHAGSLAVTPSPLIFQEVSNGTVGVGGVRVDHNGSSASFTPALSGGPIVNPAMLDGTIGAGTKFDSYFIHFDPGLNGGFYGNNSGVSVEFSTQIIGLQLFSQNATSLQKPAGTPYTGTLEAGDALVASLSSQPITYYPPATEITRGLEEDQIQIDLGGRRLSLSGVAFGGEIDQIRVFVAVPEPTTVMLAFAGLLGMSFLGITRVGRACRS